MAKIPKEVPWNSTGNTLGSGGQARIDEVNPETPEDFPFGLYAMKILNNVSSTQAKKRFIQEIEAINSINDPRIVSIDDHSEADSSFQYYVMPRYGAEKLSDIIYKQESPFLKNPRRCLGFIADCAEALHACHEKQVIHRDIKPENILMHKKSFSPIIIDFGCCQIDNDNRITLTNEGVGTPDYMAPECEAGSIDEVSYKADIYSLGKLLWTLITGKRVFAREKPAFNSQNLNRILSDNPDCWHLTLIFEQSIRNNSSDRYSTCFTMANHCRSLARNFIGKYPPLERVSITCPACGYANDPSLAPKPEHKVPLHQIFGNNKPSGVNFYQCIT